MASKTGEAAENVRASEKAVWIQSCWWVFSSFFGSSVSHLEYSVWCVSLSTLTTTTITKEEKKKKHGGGALKTDSEKLIHVKAEGKGNSGVANILMAGTLRSLLGLHGM